MSEKQIENLENITNLNEDEIDHQIIQQEIENTEPLLQTEDVSDKDEESIHISNPDENEDFSKVEQE